MVVEAVPTAGLVLCAVFVLFCGWVGARTLFRGKRRVERGEGGLLSE